MSTVHGRYTSVTCGPGVEIYRTDASRKSPIGPVRAKALSAEQRRAVWAHIQGTDPALASLLAEPGVQELRQEFGAQPVFDRDLVQAALAAAGLPPLAGAR